MRSCWENQCHIYYKSSEHPAGQKFFENSSLKRVLAFGSIIHLWIVEEFGSIELFLIYLWTHSAGVFNIAGWSFADNVGSTFSFIIGEKINTTNKTSKNILLVLLKLTSTSQLAKNHDDNHDSCWHRLRQRRPIHHGFESNSLFDGCPQETTDSKRSRSTPSVIWKQKKFYTQMITDTLLYWNN